MKEKSIKTGMTMSKHPGIEKDLTDTVIAQLTDVLKAHSESISLAGIFGRKYGRDIDLLVVGKSLESSVFSNLLDALRQKIDALRVEGIDVGIYRYANTRAFYRRVGVSGNPRLLVQLLYFPTTAALLNWEDHEIVRNMLNSISKGSNLLVGKADILQEIACLLCMPDCGLRTKRYQEMLFGALQQSFFAVSEAEKEFVLHQAHYALRYLAYDRAMRKTNKPGCLDAANHLIETLSDDSSSIMMANDLTKTWISQLANAVIFWSNSPQIEDSEPTMAERTLLEHGRYLFRQHKNLLQQDSPVVVIDADRVGENIKRIKKGFQSCFDQVRIAYALKANPHPDVVQYVLNAGCDISTSSVSSLPPIEDSARVYVHMLCPSSEDLADLANKKFDIVISDKNTLNSLLRLCAKGYSKSVLLRLSPYACDRDGYQRFGFPIANIEPLVLMCKRSGLQLSGFAMHASVRAINPDQWAFRLLPLQHALFIWRKHYPDVKPFINVGGGFASCLDLHEHQVTFDHFAQALAAALKCERDECELVIEPGRAIVGDAGFALGKIKGYQEAQDRQMQRPCIISNLGSHALVPLTSARFTFGLLNSLDRSEARAICDVADDYASFGIIGKAEVSSLKDITMGDCIIGANVGAYTLSMGSSALRPLPKVFVIASRDHEDAQSNRFYQFDTYLQAKQELDAPLLKPVMQSVAQLLFSKKKPSACEPLRILDVGCGCGAMLDHIRDAGILDQHEQIIYLGVDLKAGLIDAATAKWKNMAPPSLNAVFRVGSVYDLDRIAAAFGQWDYVVALSLLEHVESKTALRNLIAVAKPGGLIHAPINYDHDTIFEPTSDRQLEARMMENFNAAAIHNQVNDCRLGGDAYCGRKLFHLFNDAGLEVLDYSCDDWKILPTAQFDGSIPGYSENQKLFLTRIINAVAESVVPSDRQPRSLPKVISRDEAASWRAMRLRQLATGTIVFICRQNSILARKAESSEL